MKKTLNFKNKMIYFLFHQFTFIDEVNCNNYPFFAGLHCQSVLADRFLSALKDFLLLVCALVLPSAVGREGDTFGCADS
jgi:hypothetical protein